MIEIKPDCDFEKMAEYMGRSDGVFLSVRDGDELLGAALLTREGEIADIKAEFDFLYDGIIKSAINFFDRRNIKDVKCGCEHLALYLKKIGFKNENGMWSINTDKFFGTDNCEH